MKQLMLMIKNNMFNFIKEYFLKKKPVVEVFEKREFIHDIKEVISMQRVSHKMMAMPEDVRPDIKLALAYSLVEELMNDGAIVFEEREVLQEMQVEFVASLKYIK